MADDFVPLNDAPLTMEAARYNLQMRMLMSFAKDLETAEAAVRQGADRIEAAASDLRRVLSRLQTIAGTSAEHVQVTLRAVESLLAAIAEQNLANSISKAVVDNVYIEVTPLLTSAIEEIAAKVTMDLGEASSQAASQLLEIVQSVADAVAGKAPLPTLPDAGASLIRRISRRFTRSLARMHRFCITAAPILGTLAALMVLVASSLLVTHFVLHGLR